MEWEAPAIVLDARPYGEGGAIVTLFTEEYGRHAGLARGGTSRAQQGLWQPGNLIEARWVGRLSDQLGNVTGEMVHPAAALAMDDPLALSLLMAACSIAADALPEREPHPVLFTGLVSLIGHLAGGPEGVMGDYIRWEAQLLAGLGYGMDLSACASTGVTTDLIYVSPKSGRAVSAAAGAPYADRMLPLPAFLRDPAIEADDAEDWISGLRTTGYFLERDVFGARNRPLPEARARLTDRIAGEV